MVPRESKNNAYAKFCSANKEYYGIFESDQQTISPPHNAIRLRGSLHKNKAI